MCQRGCKARSVQRQIPQWQLLCSTRPARPGFRLTCLEAVRSYVEFTMTCGGFCALRQPVLQVSAVPFELHLTTRPPLTRTAVYSACLVIPAKGRSQLDSAHRRPHAYLNIVNTIGATSIVADIACGRRRVHGIHCLRYLVRIFFSAEHRALFILRLCSRLSSIPAVPSSSEESNTGLNIL